MIKFTFKKEKKSFKNNNKKRNSNKMIIDFSNVKYRVIRLLYLSEIMNLIYHFLMFDIYHLYFLYVKLQRKK